MIVEAGTTPVYRRPDDLPYRVASKLGEGGIPPAKPQQKPSAHFSFHHCEPRTELNAYLVFHSLPKAVAHGTGSVERRCIVPEGNVAPGVDVLW
jgi:hypothetical protein